MTKYFDPDYKPYNYYTYYLKNPLRLFKAPMGWLLGKIVVPHQIFDPSQDIIVSKNGFKTNYYVSRNDAQTEQDNSKRKIIILFAGNGHNWEPFDLEEEIHRNRDYATVYHPVGASSAETEIECGEALIKKLILDGYKPENMEIIGHSLGGGIAAQILNRFRYNGILKDGEAFGNYINHKSFSYLSYAASFMIFARPFYGYKFGQGGTYEMKNYNLVKFVSSCISKFLDCFGWEMATEEVLQRTDLPVKKVTILTDKNDGIIGNLSAIKSDRFKHSNEFNFVEDLEGGHNNCDGLYIDAQIKYAISRQPSKINIDGKAHELTTQFFSVNNFLNLVLLYIIGTMLSRIFVGKPLYKVLENVIKRDLVSNSIAKIGHVTRYYQTKSSNNRLI